MESVLLKEIIGESLAVFFWVLQRLFIRGQYSFRTSISLLFQITNTSIKISKKVRHVEHVRKQMSKVWIRKCLLKKKCNFLFGENSSFFGKHYIFWLQHLHIQQTNYVCNLVLQNDLLQRQKQYIEDIQPK
eukprot:TRINITY_DN5699_c0_g3_i1.p2 TRINITY_DN5699_c0_g3~~TRINITY_DN5699_c0_g3_i1.p2  ORF type:complete len:131 (+),score=0.63 TRINITY_DN5699_c0_g3_i1:218-610(+)